MKLRTISPEPISSTNESATSATATMFRDPPPPSPAVLLLPRSTSMTSGLEARNAGASPKIAADASPAKIENESTSGSMATLSRRGRFAGLIAINS